MQQLTLSPRQALPEAAAPEIKGAVSGEGPGPGYRVMGMPQTPAVPAPVACRIVRQLALEMTALASDRPLWRRDGRRSTCHVRQIAMYVCHVVLGFSQQDIGLAFGRDRSTVSYACAAVEDRRDDLGFDDFVSAVERLAQSVFKRQGDETHG